MSGARRWSMKTANGRTIITGIAVGLAMNLAMLLTFLLFDSCSVSCCT